MPSARGFLRHEGVLDCHFEKVCWADERISRQQADHRRESPSKDRPAGGGDRLSKKNIASVGIVRRIEMIGKSNNKLSMRRQCGLLSVNRSRLYYVSMSTDLPLFHGPTFMRVFPSADRLPCPPAQQSQALRRQDTRVEQLLCGVFNTVGHYTALYGQQKGTRRAALRGPEVIRNPKPSDVHLRKQALP